MKVAFFSHVSDLKGGGSRSLLDLLEYLSDEIVPVVFLPEEGELSHALEEKGIENYILPHYFWITYGKSIHALPIREKIQYIRTVIGKLRRNIYFLPKYISIIQKLNIDAFYTNTSVIYLGFILAKIFRKPHIWHVRELYGADFYYDFGATITKWVIKSSTTIIFVSNALKNTLYEGKQSDNFKVVYNGIKLASIDKLEKENKKDLSYFTFCMVGSVIPSKGHEVAVKAIGELSQRLSHIRLIIAGTTIPSYFEYLQKIIDNYQINDKIQFLGQVENPYDIYRQADVYLMCSSNETFGRVTVEAMLFGMPVIGFKSNRTGTKEIIDHEKNGLLFDGSVQQLVDYMEMLITDDELMKRLSDNAVEKSRSAFSMSNQASLISTILLKHTKN